MWAVQTQMHWYRPGNIACSFANTAILWLVAGVHSLRIMHTRSTAVLYLGVICFPACNRVNQEANNNFLAWEYRFTYQPPLSTICQHFWRPWMRESLKLGLFPFKFCSAEVKFWRWWQKRFGKSCSCVTVVMDPATYARNSPLIPHPKNDAISFRHFMLGEKWQIKSHRNTVNAWQTLQIIPYTQMSRWYNLEVSEMM